MHIIKNWFIYKNNFKYFVETSKFRYLEISSAFKISISLQALIKENLFWSKVDFIAENISQIWWIVLK